MTPLLVMIGAAVGAGLRFETASRFDGRFPTGTLVVNVVGSFLLGLFSGRVADSAHRQLIGAGR